MEADNLYGEIVLRQENRISTAQLRTVLSYALNARTEGAKRVLLVPQAAQVDETGVAQAAQVAIEFLKRRCRVDVLPAVGMGAPLAEKQLRRLFGRGLPLERFYTCDERITTPLGELDAARMRALSGGAVDQAVPVALYGRLAKYDAVISVSAVAPDALWGMSGYTQNLAFGIGTQPVRQAIQALAQADPAAMPAGRPDTPLTRLMQALQQDFLDRLPVTHILIVNEHGGSGVFIGSGSRLFEQACAYSCKCAFTLVKKPVQRMIALIDEQVASMRKALHALPRLQSAMADGGELLLIAPGVRRVGDMAKSRVVLPARFTVCIAPAPELDASDVQAAGCTHMPLQQALDTYQPDSLSEGMNILPEGEPAYLVRQPMAGWWALERGDLPLPG